MKYAIIPIRRLCT